MSDDKPAPSTTNATAVIDMPTTWDEHYDNPKNEIVLVSNDNVGLRVDAWTFSKKSQFIKDLLELPSDQKLDQAPIQLECPSSVARSFCDIVHARAGGAVEVRCNMSGFRSLFALADRFEAPTVAKAISEALRLRVDALSRSSDFNLWDMYKLAAGRDDYELARRTAVAIAHTDPYIDSKLLTPVPQITRTFRLDTSARWCEASWSAIYTHLDATSFTAAQLIDIGWYEATHRRSTSIST